jgi:hypothetical protein
MTAEFPRTSYERATREYDREFQQRLTGEILTAIAQASIVSGPGLRIMALRTGETLQALITCLISFAAMSPHFDVVAPAGVRRDAGEAHPPRCREGARRGRARPRLYCRSAAASGTSMSAFAAIDYATHAFSPTAQEVARFLRSIGVGANNDTVLLLATLDRRFPGLSLHELHEATVLVEALTLETRGNA